MPRFNADTLGALRDAREIAVRTGQHPNSAVVIWVVVADDDVFIRSVRGPRGRWYKDLATGGPATLELGDRQIPVQAVPVQAIPAPDAASVERASREYLAKYRTSPYAQAMVRAEVLLTTLRLEPR